ncbi:MAG: c-type cytochrome [Acidobacteria bacterium]|nr:c-type cytochrome [Acidobacteriota bacterium]
MQRAVRTGAGLGALLLLAATGGVGSASTAPGPAGSIRGEAGQAQDERRQAPYDAQQRPPGNPAIIARGQVLYGIHCRGCHGIDLRGGDLGGPNLLRSQLVLRDRQGELIWPVLRDGQSTPGVSSMPAQSLSETDAAAVAEFIHSILATSTRQGGPPAGPEIELDIVVGDAAAGRAYFEATCTSCHAADGDLAGIATRIPDAKMLQNTWVRGRQRGAPRPPVRVTVTETSGARTEGHLARLDDFLVALTTDDGRRRSFRRQGGTPRVEIEDPMARHTELLGVYSDADIHDVTAYLVTLQ